MCLRLLLLLVVYALAGCSQAAAFDAGAWSHLLQKHVRVYQGGSVTAVDYAGLLADKPALDRFLHATSAVRAEAFARWPKQDQLAFLINAYNAWTIDLVLTGYPGLHSIKDLGGLFASPWKKNFIPLLGQLLSLDDIEQGLIRGSETFHEPRVHFALNCASRGCPPLRPEAYDGAHLEQQLDDQTRKFLKDRDRNRLQGHTLQISSIFKWYADDFTQGWHGMTRLPVFLAHYASALGLNATETRLLLEGKIDITYLPYDWQLNAAGS